MVLTYKNMFNIKYKFKRDEPHSIEEISKLTGYKLSGLQTIVNKGIGAYSTSRNSVRPQVKSAEQWGMARLYASLNPSSKAYKVDKMHLVKK